MPDLSSAKKIWAPVAQTGAWLAGLVGGLVVSPPMLWVDATHTDYARITQLLLAFVAGLVFVASRSRSPGVRTWVIAAALGLAVAVVLFFVYGYLTVAWTCPYAGEAAVRGSQYLEAASGYATSHPELSCTDIIMSYAGRTNQIWPEGELVSRQIAVSACFMALSVALSVAVMSLVEAIRLAQGPSRRPARRRSPPNA